MNEEDIFHEALNRSRPEERAAYLERACVGDPALRANVEALLRANVGASGFLDQPPPQLVATVDEQPIKERPGTTIGPYRLMEEIGEGGMGLVFVAEQQQPVRRKVALKVIKPGMDTRHVVARFEQERQALALMDHPNIAKVHDGGTTGSGRPYFVMELVKGVPITQFCDDSHLSVRDRLHLFLDVCAAIQHAHQKGIIHRDVKPGNVLVTSHDGTPVVKVIDFGVAKAVGQQLTDKTLYTQFSQLVGTPLYMSPEQAGQSSLDVDTRTDVYALGVLLYELLTGQTPFDGERLRTVGLDEMRRIIREEEPVRPSTRISTLGHAASTVSRNRHSDPSALRQLVRGDLDWIVLKALEKDRNRRYESASAFAADVRRYLHDDPVLACPPSPGYRLRKLVRRHRGPVLAAALVVLALVGGIVGTTVGMLRAATEAKQKNEALEDRTVALADAEGQLFTALVQRARAERSSGSVGQRFEALKLIRQAARTRITPELRTEAAAALIRPDVEVAHEWEAWPEGSQWPLAFDADFVRYVRADKQGEITVCRRTNEQEEILARHRSPGPIVVGPWMSPDGRYLATGHRGRPQTGAAEVRVYRLEGARVEDAFLVPEGIHQWALAFRPDSRQLAIGHANGWVSVYDLERGERIRRLEIGVASWTLAFHPKDSRLAVVAGNAVRLFDVDTGKELPALRHAASVVRIEHLAWHPDGVRLATACLDRKIHFWDTRTATEVMTLVDGTEGTAVSFHPTGDLLLSTNYTYQSRVWDVATGRLLLKTPTAIGHRFSRDGRLVGVSVAGTKARLWRVAPGRELRVLRRRNADSLETLVFPVLHPNGRTLAASGESGLSFFDVISGEELGTASLPHLGAASPASFVPPGRSSSDGQKEEAEPTGGWMTGGLGGVLFWPTQFDPARPSVLRVGPARRFLPDSGAGYSREASMSQDGRVVAVPQGSSTLVIHRDKPERRLVLGPQDDVRFSAVSPDGRWVFSGTHWENGKSSTARIWDAQTGKPEQELPHYYSTAARFSPDSKWLLTVSADVRLWQVDGWREVRRLSGAGRFSPDSRLLVVSDGIGVIRLEETTTGREVARLTGPEPVSYIPLCFTPDGTRLIAADGMNSALYVFDLRQIREGLKELGLDWDWPEFPKALPDETPRVTRVEILPGDLGKPALSPEQRAKQAIAEYRQRLEKNPNDPTACNNLAWTYLTAPEPLRDPKAALPWAEKAVQLKPGSPIFANTLGLAYLRARRYREAVAVLHPNLEMQVDGCLGHDLYLLAICHHELGEPERARDYYDWAVRWTRTHRGRNPGEVEELVEFRAEVEKLLGVKKSK